MEYQEVKCRNCGSPMHVAEGAERIRCPYCGTEYILNSHNRQENSVHVINYGGRGALFLCHSSGSAVSSCEAVFDRFLKELKYGPLYFALQDEELQRARQIQLQGATFPDLGYRKPGLPGSQPPDGSHLRPLHRRYPWRRTLP